MRGLGFLLVIMISSDESCCGDGGSLSLTYHYIGESGTRECNGDVNISSIAKISAESWIYLMFVESFGTG